ncbi:hypothetical protein Tco_0970273 [Tanacetum coccineum]
MVSRFKTFPATDSGERQRLANLKRISASEMWEEHPLAESGVLNVVKIAGKRKYEIEIWLLSPARVSAEDGVGEIA